MAAYNFSIIVWVTYSVMKSPAREAVNTLLTSQRWNHSLEDIQHPETSESIIPVFESMVDRAFSRMDPSTLGPSTLEKLEKLSQPAPNQERTSSASAKD